MYVMSSLSRVIWRNYSDKKGRASADAINTKPNDRRVYISCARLVSALPIHVKVGIHLCLAYSVV